MDHYGSDSGDSESDYACSKRQKLDNGRYDSGPNLKLQMDAKFKNMRLLRQQRKDSPEPNVSLPTPENSSSSENSVSGEELLQQQQQQLLTNSVETNEVTTFLTLNGTITNGNCNDESPEPNLLQYPNETILRFDESDDDCFMSDDEPITECISNSVTETTTTVEIESSVTHSDKETSCSIVTTLTAEEIIKIKTLHSTTVSEKEVDTTPLESGEDETNSSTEEVGTKQSIVIADLISDVMFLNDIHDLPFPLVVEQDKDSEGSVAESDRSDKSTQVQESSNARNECSSSTQTCANVSSTTTPLRFGNHYLDPNDDNFYDCLDIDEHLNNINTLLKNTITCDPNANNDFIVDEAFRQLFEIFGSNISCDFEPEVGSGEVNDNNLITTSGNTLETNLVTSNSSNTNLSSESSLVNLTGFVPSFNNLSLSSNVRIDWRDLIHGNQDVENDNDSV